MWWKTWRCWKQGYAEWPICVIRRTSRFILRGLWIWVRLMAGCGSQEMMEDPGPWFVEGFHLPSDVVHQIVTLLPERDLCALKLCSRYWHSVCSSDLLWFQLFRKRWKSADPLTAISPFLNLHGKERPQLRLCDCSIARPCATHNLYRKPHEVTLIPISSFHLHIGLAGAEVSHGWSSFGRLHVIVSISMLLYLHRVSIICKESNHFHVNQSSTRRIRFGRCWEQSWIIQLRQNFIPLYPSLCSCASIVFL